MTPDRRRHIVFLPQGRGTGTPANGCLQGALLGEARHLDTVFAMGDNPALPAMLPSASS